MLDSPGHPIPLPKASGAQVWHPSPTFSISHTPSSLSPGHLCYLGTQFPLPPSTLLPFTAPSKSSQVSSLKAASNFPPLLHGLAPAHLADLWCSLPLWPCPGLLETPRTCPLLPAPGTWCCTPPTSALLASAYLSIPSSKFVLREEAFPDHTARSRPLPCLLLPSVTSCSELLVCW